MTKIKKITAIIVAAIGCMTMATNVFASSPKQNYDIPLEADYLSSFVYQYNIYFEASPGEDDEPIQGAYVGLQSPHGDIL